MSMTGSSGSMRCFKSELTIGLPVLALTFLMTSVVRAADPITQQWLVPMGSYPIGTPSLGADGTVVVGHPRRLILLNPNGSLNRGLNFGWSYLTNAACGVNHVDEGALAEEMQPCRVPVRSETPVNVATPDWRRFNPN